MNNVILPLLGFHRLNVYYDLYATIRSQDKHTGDTCLC